MLFFPQRGYRVIGHDRRGPGRSEQTGDGHDTNHCSDAWAAVIEHLDLHEAIHVATRPLAVTHRDYSHGMPAPHAHMINADLLEFL
jgi:non-heme chloroperoxidase